MFKKISNFIKKKDLEKYESLIFILSLSFFVIVLCFCYPNIRPYVKEYFMEFFVAILGGCFTYEQIKIMKGNQKLAIDNQKFMKYQYKQQRVDLLYDKKLVLFYKFRKLYIDKISKSKDCIESILNQLSEIEKVDKLGRNILDKKIGEISFEIRKIEVEARVLLNEQIYEKFKEATNKLENLYTNSISLNQDICNWFLIKEWNKDKYNRIVDAKSIEIAENRKNLEKWAECVENIIVNSMHIEEK